MLNRVIRLLRVPFIALGLIKPRVYVACALTQAPEDFRQQIAFFKAELGKMGCEVMEFLGLMKGTPQDVYQYDIHHCVAKCDFMIAICDYPSIGLGYELCMAIEKLGTPVYAFAREDSLVTRLIQGINYRKYNFCRYRRLVEVLEVMTPVLSKPVRLITGPA